MKTFDICDVEIAKSELDQLPADFVVKGLLGAEIESCSTTVGRMVDTRERTTFDQDLENQNPFAANYGHPVIEAAGLAFARHYPLTLSPDHIWMLICQGFATHVNVNAEKLRDRFVQHEGKMTLEVVRETWGNTYAEWAGVFTEFAEQVTGQIGEIGEVMSARYSTTTLVEQAAFNMMLMKTVEDYFEYQFSTLCGIPRITLEGISEDWEELHHRAENLRAYDLEWWIDPLLPILNEFVAASKGRVDKEFWNNLFKWKNESGGPYITGWIGNFFPYIYKNRQRKDNPDVWERVLIPNPFLDEDPPMFGGLKKNIIPNSLAQVPFIWTHMAHDPLDMLASAGFIGVSQHPQTFTLRPEIGWAVSKESAFVDKQALLMQEASRLHDKRLQLMQEATRRFKESINDENS